MIVVIDAKPCAVIGVPHREYCAVSGITQTRIGVVVLLEICRLSARSR
jgi:hypothetical protein